MKREDAYYHLLLLMTGLDDGYHEWLTHRLETEETLDGIVLELAWCGRDVSKTVSTLSAYCVEQPFDEASVYDRVRRFYQQAYHARRMSKEEIVSSMHRMACNAGSIAVPGFDEQLWASMEDLDYYYDCAKDGVISRENFDQAFFALLDHGIPVDPKRMWSRSKKETILQRIKRLLHG